jgi:putative heme-binding domain-containing protein
VVLHPRYLRRNPHLAFSDTVQDVSPHGDAAKVWPLSEDHTTAAFHPRLMSTPHAGTFTAACGSIIYRGNALPPDMYGNAFVCEPAQNLVQRQIVEPDGPTFKSRPATPGRDSLATADTWFRPVFNANGPDGALYICDMYRKIVDHPQYLPEHIRGSLDYDAGKGMGRIYRLVAADAKTQNPKPKTDLSKASTKELVSALNADNGWTRDTAFRLLFERQDRAAVADLKSQISYLKSANPAARVAALRLLSLQGALDDEALITALSDPSGEVVEHTFQLAEGRLVELLPDAGLASLRAQYARPTSRLGFQWALALGTNVPPATISQLANIAVGDAANRWTRAAVFSAVAGQTDRLFEEILAQHIAGPKPFDIAPLMPELGQLLAAALTPDKLRGALEKGLASRNPADQLWQIAFSTGVANGARSRGLAKGGKSALVNLMTGDSPAAKQAAQRLGELFQNAQKLALNANLPLAERTAAIELLAHADFAQSGPALQGLLNLQTPTEVQVAAVRALAQMPDDSVGATFIAKWRAYTPPVREAVVNALLSQARFLPALLEAAEQGVVQGWAIPANRRNTLLKHKDAAIRDRAAKIFAELEGGDRLKVYEEYKSVLQMKGNARNGHTVFTTACASCHRYHDEGFQVGPDLSGVRQQPADALLLHIIVPNAEIYPGFSAYEAETRDGRSITGLLVSETPTSVTIRAAQGLEETILRSELASLSSTSLSLMPDDLEKTMTKQELADLLAFLKGE